MKVVYALEELPDEITESIFLAGPTPRSEDGNPWRQEALRILEEKGFNGVVFVPEPRNKKWHREYDRQVEWEDLCLNVADCIVFWIPRTLDTMPGFTTNIEWGRWENSGKIVLGYPPDAAKMSYIDFYAKAENIIICSSLEDTLGKAMAFTKNNEDPRQWGERYVPLHIWKTPQFKQWLHFQEMNGNSLESAKVLFTSFYRGREVFMFILRVNMFVLCENRIKEHDFIVSRTDISSVVMWKKNEPIEESEFVLVREYRPPVANTQALVMELPSGSSVHNINPIDTVIEEVKEETGFTVDASRLRPMGSRQVASTLCTHKSNLFSLELSQEEIDWFKAQYNKRFGVIEEGEITHVEVMKLKQIEQSDWLDWSTIGQIMSVIK